MAAPGKSKSGVVGCSFCNSPTKGPLQFYHDEAKAKLGRCLVVNFKACGNLCAEREGTVGPEQAHKAFEAYLEDTTSWFSKNGHDLQQFFGTKVFNACLEASAAREKAAVPKPAEKPKKYW